MNLGRDEAIGGAKKETRTIGSVEKRARRFGFGKVLFVVYEERLPGSGNLLVAHQRALSIARESRMIALDVVLDPIVQLALEQCVGLV